MNQTLNNSNVQQSQMYKTQGSITSRHSNFRKSEYLADKNIPDVVQVEDKCAQTKKCKPQVAQTQGKSMNNISEIINLGNLMNQNIVKHKKELMELSARQLIDWKDEKTFKMITTIMSKQKKTGAEVKFIAKALGTLNLFNSQNLGITLNLENTPDIVNQLHLQIYQKHTQIYKKGDLSTNFFIVLQGSVQALIPACNEYASKQQKELDHLLKKIKQKKVIDNIDQAYYESNFNSMMLTRKYVSGDIFGEIELLNKDRRIQTMICDEDTQLLAITREGFENLIVNQKNYIIQQLIDFFRDYSFMKDIPQTYLFTIASFLEETSYSGQSAIYDYGDEVKQIYFIREGEVSIYRNSNPVQNTNKNVLLSPKQLDQSPINIWNGQDENQTFSNSLKVFYKKQQTQKLSTQCQGSYFGVDEIYLNSPNRIYKAICSSQSALILKLEKRVLVNAIKKFNLYSTFESDIKAKYMWHQMQEQKISDTNYQVGNIINTKIQQMKSQEIYYTNESSESQQQSLKNQQALKSQLKHAKFINPIQNEELQFYAKKLQHCASYSDTKNFNTGTSSTKSSSIKKQIVPECPEDLQSFYTSEQVSHSIFEISQKQQPQQMSVKQMQSKRLKNTFCTTENELSSVSGQQSSKHISQKSQSKNISGFLDQQITTMSEDCLDQPSILQKNSYIKKFMKIYKLDKLVLSSQEKKAYINTRQQQEQIAKSNCFVLYRNPSIKSFASTKMQSTDVKEGRQIVLNNSIVHEPSQQRISGLRARHYSQEKLPKQIMFFEDRRCFQKLPSIHSFAQSQFSSTQSNILTPKFRLLEKKKLHRYSEEQ